MTCRRFILFYFCWKEPQDEKILCQMNCYPISAELRSTLHPFTHFFTQRFSQVNAVSLSALTLCIHSNLPSLPTNPCMTEGVDNIYSQLTVQRTFPKPYLSCCLFLVLWSRQVISVGYFEVSLGAHLNFFPPDIGFSWVTPGLLAEMKLQMKPSSQCCS